MAGTPEIVTPTGLIRAEAIVQGRVDLRGYPNYLLTVVSDRGVGAARVTTAIAAAEAVCRLGWEVVSMFPFGQVKDVYVILQRRATCPSS